MYLKEARWLSGLISDQWALANPGAKGLNPARSIVRFIPGIPMSFNNNKNFQPRLLKVSIKK